MRRRCPGRATGSERAPVIKGHRRRSDGMQGKTSTLPGEISLAPERVTHSRSEKSAEAVVADIEAEQGYHPEGSEDFGGSEGPNERRANRP